MITNIPITNFATSARLNRTIQTNVIAINSKKRIFDKLINIDRYFDSDDVIIINDSAVIPGSFYGIHVPSKELIELRLVRYLSQDKNNYTLWEAIAYGEGNWLTPTEQRLDPPVIQPGDVIIIQDLSAEVKYTSLNSGRLLTIEFKVDNNELLSKIYKYGNLIQYSYLQEELNLWDHQTLFSSIPVSIEPSSSLFQLNWNLIDRLQGKGIEIIPITHAISISNTGIPEIDKKLPFPERYWLSEHSAKRLNKAHKEHKHFIAFGTSVCRSLESIIQNNGYFIPGSAEADLVLDKNYSLTITGGILTGMHMINESHINLLQSFLSLDRILESYSQGVDKGFLWHEYGDSMLIKNF